MLDKGNLSSARSVFAFSKDMTLLFLQMPQARQKRKLVCLLFSIHDHPVISVNGKPEIITVHNSTEGDVDTLHQMCSYWSCSLWGKGDLLRCSWGVECIRGGCVYSEPQTTLKGRLFQRKLTSNAIKPMAQSVFPTRCCLPPYGPPSTSHFRDSGNYWRQENAAKFAIPTAKKDEVSLHAEPIFTTKNMKHV